MDQSKLPTMGETKLGDIIDKVRRTEPLRKYWLTEDVLNRIMYLAKEADNYAEEGKFDGYSDYRNRLRQYIIEAAGD